MLKIPNIECLICGKVFKDPVKLPCGSVICSSHQTLPVCQMEIEVLCVLCNQFHKMPKNGFPKEKIMDHTFEKLGLTNQKENLILFEEAVKRLKGLRYQLAKQLNIQSTTNYNSFDDLVQFEKKQALDYLDAQFENFKISCFDQANKVDEIYDELKNSIETQKELCVRHVKNPTTDPDFDKTVTDFNRLIQLFFSGPKTINRHTYRDFIQNYFKFLKVHEYLGLIEEDKIIEKMKSSFYEINNQDDLENFFLLDSTFEFNKVF